VDAVANRTYTAGRMSFVPMTGPTGRCHVYFGFGDPTANAFTFHTAFISLLSSGTFSVPQLFVRAASPASFPFVIDGRRYMWLQATWGTFNPAVVNAQLYLYEDQNLDGTLATLSGRALYGTAGYGTVGPFSCARVIVDSNGQFATVSAEQFRLALFSTINLSPSAISRLTIGSSLQVPITRASLGGILVSGGALPSMYDGDNPTEIGFVDYPEMITVVDAGVGNLAAGTYQWAATYEGTDNAGNRWQSAPNSTLNSTVTLAAGRQMNVSVPTLRHSARLARLVQIVLWRTQANGSILNRLTSPGAGIVNDPTVDNITILDNATDASIAANEVLYTSRALSNVSPPTARFVVAHKNRIFLAGMEDPQAIWPSRKYQPGDAVNFSDSPG